ncbi:hypothetical protein LguiA_005249 [Lonicera macranthoides]
MGMLNHQLKTKAEDVQLLWQMSHQLKTKAGDVQLLWQMSHLLKTKAGDVQLLGQMSHHHLEKIDYMIQWTDYPSTKYLKERRERDTHHHLLHAHIVHRDLKRQNLLLDESNNLKFSDFGLSALPEQLNNGLLHTACETPAYTAPEVVRRKGYDGTRADAWSYGVILFVFLAGSLSLNDSNLPNMYRKIYHREFNMPDWISKLTQNLIYRLLNLNPVTRMSIEEMMSDN